MANILVSSGQNPPQPTGTPGVFSVDFAAAAEGISTGFGFTVDVTISGSNPTPGMRAAIEAAAINQVQLLGGTFGGNDKVVLLVQPTL